jgi:hypothetical protein
MELREQQGALGRVIEQSPVHRTSHLDRVEHRERQRPGPWRTPLNVLTKPVMSAGRKVALGVLGGYMVIAMVLVIVRSSS